ncbi:hypothetical protein Dsin_032711 [Dipteronia sinensis]|uniref:Uncharacterized protein n=1 Tax=Dipteronia sinensis TaxID=43782 RepID=A0AAE0DMP7_9ROSI|nr:hypothetical protein Dsin_032711 [Dipteronia sinensis]
MCKCRSHGTFPLFGLQSSHLNICYYHQDLHRRPLARLAPWVLQRPPRPPTHRAWHLPRRPGIGRALQRHPFSGLVDSQVSAQLGTVTRLPVHPASPVRLPKMAHLELSIRGALNEAAAPSYLFKFENRSRLSLRASTKFPLASPRSGIVHHLSGPDRHALTRTLLRRSRSVGGATREGSPPISSLRLRVYWPVDSHTCQTPWSVFQDGRMGARRPMPESAGARGTPYGARCQPRSRRRRLHKHIAWAWATAAIRIGPRPDDRRTACDRSTSDRGASPAPIRFPPDNFKHSLTLFSKSFSSFPRGSGRDGAFTLSGAPFQGTWARSAAEDASPDYNSNVEDARFSSWALPGSLAVTRGILVSFFSSAY